MSEQNTVFKRVDYDVGGLLHYIDVGDIGLPDIQRPFVWRPSKVRDLFDSMYRGFPVGYLLFWENDAVSGVKHIGVDDKGHKVPSRLIVDGQQRLTSLYAVFRGRAILDENYLERRIEIAFRPRDCRFEVCDAAIRRDPEFIPDISVVLASGAPGYTIVKSFLAQVSAKQALSEDEEQSISHNIERLLALPKFPFTALEIASTVDEEHVSDIFVRINSEGVALNQADFILTLMSVFAEDLRQALERFCRDARHPPAPGVGASPYNHFIQPSPDQLLRVAVAVGFCRARLRSVYQVLRGKDPETETYLPELREQQFGRLRASQEKTLKLTHWHQFMKALVGAGFRGSDMVSSQSALLYAYALYLIGKTRYGVKDYALDKLIGRWFFATTLTGRYTSSPETVMDSDLNRFKDLPGPDAFVASLGHIIDDVLTNDFWSITLPNELATSSPRSPELFAYHAAQNLLKAPVLFSAKRISDLMDPVLKTTKSALERHHLFARGWLESQGVTDLRQINQAANFAWLEWPDNASVSDAPPHEYVPEMRKRFAAAPGLWQEMCVLHALPDGWEDMGYDEFLVCRRRLMAAIVRRGFETLR